MNRQHEWNSHQRGAWVAVWLWTGARLSNRDVARLCGITPQGAHKMMTILEATLPIVFDADAGVWRWIEKE